MKRKHALFIFVIAFIGISANAQSDATHKDAAISIERIAVKDSTTLLYKEIFGNIDSVLLNTDYTHVPYNIKYYKLFMPVTFYSSAIKEITEVPQRSLVPDSFYVSDLEWLTYDKSKFSTLKEGNKQADKILRNIYATNMELVVYTEDYINSRKPFRRDVEVKIAPKARVLELFQSDKAIEDVGTAGMIIQKPNFWTKSGDASLQISQNYISKNWYKGGESSNTLRTTIKLAANYNDKEKVQWENFLEIKAGFNTVPSDTIREYNINTDLLRLYSKIGVQASKKWYYTIASEFNTQFFNNYKTNSHKRISSFLSPATWVSSIGMDYKLKKKKNMELSVFIAPATYNLKIVANKKVDETKFGLKKGEKFLHDFGSKMESRLSWTIIPSVTLTSRLYYFTSYDKIEAEWENTFNFVLNKYLSTKLFFHGRFDDSVNKNGKSHFQWQELLSFGLNYKW
ncbi:DUF3078 domain-containing protein [Bacteroides sp. 214]|uniref:DUF3078 domain-containing protein n=1 Tax=Bacteroides sp. 214 TaxID=2302935 RepID=UPI0013D1846D|nr:DUF3078 domain-containing protein [Bacteroides sp. 214]NDW12794.1 DUF3078 domain-containing protein [Bacteroides sp. 214]